MQGRDGQLQGVHVRYGCQTVTRPRSEQSKIEGVGGIEIDGTRRIEGERWRTLEMEMEGGREMEKATEREYLCEGQRH